MSAPLRFLGLAILGYVGLRTAAGAFAPLAAIPIPAPATPLLDALAMNQLAAPEPLAASGMPLPPPGAPPLPYGPAMIPVAMPYPVQAFAPPPRVSSPILYREASYAPQPYAAPLPPFGDAPFTALPSGAGEATVAPQTTPGWTGKKLRLPGSNRWSLSSWAMLRTPDAERLYSEEGLSQPLAPAGLLGGSQAGARLSYRATDRLAVGLRVSAPVDQQNQQSVAGEAALGVSWRPLRSVPVRLVAERRQRFGPEGGGRNAFAFLAEGGVYAQPLGWGMLLDGYGQAGVVGFASRDLFAEGAVSVTRPVLGRFALGGGLWGGTQPGLSRFDAGPRLSYRISPRVRAHLDYRWKVVGNASPPSGPAVTLSGDW